MSHVVHHQVCMCVWVYAKKCILDISLSFFFFFLRNSVFLVGGFIIIIIIIYFGCAGSSLVMVLRFHVAHELI